MTTSAAKFIHDERGIQTFGKAPGRALVRLHADLRLFLAHGPSERGDGVTSLPTAHPVCPICTLATGLLCPNRRPWLQLAEDPLVKLTNDQVDNDFATVLACSMNNFANEPGVRFLRVRMAIA